VLVLGMQLKRVCACGGKGQAGGTLEEEGLGVESQEWWERGGGERGQRVGEKRVDRGGGEGRQGSC
jgi:hypothetical protein